MCGDGVMMVVVTLMGDGSSRVIIVGVEQQSAVVIRQSLWIIVPV